MAFGVSNSGMMPPPGGGNEFDDNALIRAARRRIVRELDAQQQAAQAGQVTNNNYGGGGGHEPPGLMERMNGAQSDDPGLYDYLVDIEKRDLPEMNEKGKPIGWTKKVHRHREEKKK